MSLERDLPNLARYVLAEAVSTDAVAHDPWSYAFTVARSPDWQPDWLRLLLLATNWLMEQAEATRSSRILSKSWSGTPTP